MYIIDLIILYDVYTLMRLLTRRPPTKNDLLMSAEGKLRGVSWGLITDHSLQCFNGTNCKTILCSKMTDVFSRSRAEAKESRGASSFSAFWWTLGDPICDARRSTSCFWLTFRASTWVDIYERWRADRIAIWQKESCYVAKLPWTSMEVRKVPWILLLLRAVR